MSKSLALTAIKSPSLMDIAWASGIYEGEGCICLSKGSSQVLQITQSEAGEWILFRLIFLFGGSITDKTGNRSGNRIYAWQVCGPRARGFIYTIYKFLSPRRQLQARVALRIKG